MNAGAGNKVTLRGLTINGLGGTTGIAFQSGAALYLHDVTVKGFNAGGAVGVSAALGAATASLVIRDSAFRDNAIGLATDTTSGTVTLDIERAMFERNAIGADVQGTAYGAIRKSTFSAGGVGISAGAANSGQTVELDIRGLHGERQRRHRKYAAVAPLSPTTLTVISSSVSGNATGIQATGIGNKAYASDNTIMRNDIALNATSSGTVLSGGDNRLLFNISDGIFATELINGALHRGSISSAGEVDTWTFTANAGDRIAVHIGEIADNNDFRPWIRLGARPGARSARRRLDAAAVIDGIAAPLTRDLPGPGRQLRQRVRRHRHVSPHHDAHARPDHRVAGRPGRAADQRRDPHRRDPAGRPGRLDVHRHRRRAHRRAHRRDRPTPTTSVRGFGCGLPTARRWPSPVRYRRRARSTTRSRRSPAPTSCSSRASTAASTAPARIASRWRTRRAPSRCPPGDQGGPLTNGALHTGEILQGDLDVWTFTANAGDRIAVHIGEIVGHRRLPAVDSPVGPERRDLGSHVRHSTRPRSTASSHPSPAPTSCWSSSFDSGFDGTGTYRLTMTHTPGPITVSPAIRAGR